PGVHLTRGRRILNQDFGDARPDEAQNNAPFAVKLPRQIEITADAVISLADKTGRVQRTHILATGRTINEQALWLQKSSVEGAPLASKPGLRSGSFHIRIHPRMNGEETISLYADWGVEFLWRVPGQKTTLRLHDEFTANGRVTDDHILNLASTQWDMGQGQMATVALRLMPHLIQDPPATIKPAQPGR
ncbi:MAG TPA: hypothetical protein VKT32_16465, partial [Chthonomonadaceae bacterium]|nr:hypothetical protein [Chthonomonadaceae bacterium]